MFNRFATPTLRLHWGLLCALVGMMCLLYLSTSLNAYSHALLMPLDDSYIHFQYARQMAEGQPYRYNTDEDRSSGATSFLYTPLLAIGHKAGFHDLNLSLWAVGLGALLHLCNSWLIYRLISTQPRWEAWGVAIAYTISGPFLWAALSGMETSLAVFSLLLTLYGYYQKWGRWTLVSAGLAALIRPEFAIVSLTTLAAVAWRAAGRGNWRAKWRAMLRVPHRLYYIVPILGVLTQPVVNLLLTGHSTANGNLAKSHLYNVTIPMLERLELIGGNYMRFWGEFITGGSDVDGWYLAPLLTLTAFGAMLISLRASYKARTLTPGGLITVWVVVLGIAIASLDTAFWHFKRYQLPLMALCFPLAGWLWLYVQDQWERREGALETVIVACVAFSLWTSVVFAIRYHANVELVANQQLAMADWVAENIPSEAIIGVHDVGMMRYRGDHRTYDVVGLTESDPAIARAWRQGSGTIYEVMADSSKRPDYFAIYPDTAALPFLVGSAVMGEELTRFERPLSPDVVASATATQVVTLANWDGVVTSPELPPELPLVQLFNVGDLEEEANVHYTWALEGPFEGFASQSMRLGYRQCAQAPCQMIDGVRVVTAETFTLDQQGPLTLLLRVHAANAANLIIGCEGQIDDIAVVPTLPGQWVNIPMTTTPASGKICIRSDAPYYPARYWVYGGQLPLESTPRVAEIRFSVPSNTSILSLYTVGITQSSDSVAVHLELLTDGGFGEDGKLFVHLYQDLDSPPVAQMEDYFRADQPPANWLAGWMSGTFVLPLQGVEAGHYQLAIGFYNPQTGQRFAIEAIDELTVDNGRVIVQEIDIP